MTLKVVLWGNEVGRLFWDERKGVSVFAYSKEFLAGGLDVSPLDMSTSAVNAAIPVEGSRERADIEKYCGLPPFISDSLPDKWGNDVFVTWAQKNGHDPEKVSPVHKLAFIGSRGMGALEFYPQEDVAMSTAALEIDEIIELASKITDDRAAARILAEEEITLQSLYLVGTSAGGQRKKAIVAMNEERTEIRSGQIMGLDKEGFKYYILKFNERDDFPSAEIEAAYYDMLTLCGIRMMPSDLFRVQGVNHFLTERFDRQNGDRQYTQTLAAIKPHVKSYEELFDVCRDLGLGENRVQEIFRRMAFDVLSGNTDDHDKNVSFIMSRDGKWDLAPAYDVTFTAPVYSPDLIYHSRSLLGKTRGLGYDDLVAFADACGIRNAKQSLDSVCSALTQWRKVASERGVFPQWIDTIEKFISGLLPEEYSEKMQGWILPPFNPFTLEDGRTISSIRFEETESGNVHMYAVIDGWEHRHVFASNKPETRDLKLAGLDRMPYETKIELVRRYLS